MSSSAEEGNSSGRPEQPRMVKWSPPYRRENVEMPEFDLIEIERDGPIGRIVMNSPEKRNPLGYERLLQIEMAAKLLELDDDVRVIIIKGHQGDFTGEPSNMGLDTLGCRTVDKDAGHGGS